MKKSKKLMWKIFAFLLGFCSILLATLWLFEIVLLDKMYENVRRNEIEKAIVLVKKNIDSPELNQIIWDLADNSEIIVTPEHSFEPPREPKPSEKPPIRRAITKKQEFIREDGEVISFVFYAIISPVKATTSTIKVQLYYVTALMLGLSIALAFVIAKMVSRPIEELNESAKVLADGNYKTHFSGKTYREIHELSNTLNYTAQELSKVEDLRRELMANISHDLRTPLALIYGYAEMMHDFPCEVTREHTELIMDESKRLSSLVGDILDVSQLEAGTMELKTSYYNLTASLRATIGRIGRLVDKDGFKLNFNYDKEVYINADEVKITQAFYNLLINAINYSNEDRNITINQTADGEYVKIEIVDHGDGIEKDKLPYIWDRYYKTGKIHKRAIVGSGLGLSIVKKIIEMHKGKYGVESTPAQGSNFWFSLYL